MQNSSILHMSILMETQTFLFTVSYLLLWLGVIVCLFSASFDDRTDLNTILDNFVSPVQLTCVFLYCERKKDLVAKPHRQKRTQKITRAA